MPQKLKYFYVYSNLSITIFSIDPMNKSVSKKGTLYQCDINQN